MRVIQFADAINQLHQVMNQVVSDCDVTIISCGGGKAAVLMSDRFYSGMMETMYLLKSPANVKNLNRSLTQHHKG